MTDSKSSEGLSSEEKKELSALRTTCEYMVSDLAWERFKTLLQKEAANDYLWNRAQT